MGYSHYMRAKMDAPTEQQVADFKAAFHGMLQEVGFEVEINREDETALWFNGVGEYEHETCIIPFTGGGGSEFCKTNRKPYDALVVASYIVATSYGLLADWWSDGDHSEHAAGYALAQKVL